MSSANVTDLKYISVYNGIDVFYAKQACSAYCSTLQSFRSLDVYLSSAELAFWDNEGSSERYQPVEIYYLASISPAQSCEKTELYVDRRTLVDCLMSVTRKITSQDKLKSSPRLQSEDCKDLKVLQKALSTRLSGFFFVKDYVCSVVSVQIYCSIRLWKLRLLLWSLVLWSS